MHIEEEGEEEKAALSFVGFQGINSLGVQKGYFLI